MAQQSKRYNQKSAKGNILVYLVILSIAVAVGVYWYQTKDEMAETYKIRSANGDQFFKEKSYINLTGKAVEEKKIKLSEDYWTSGKFK